MEKYTLEVCVDSVESAIAAEKGGADRLEVCGNLVIGGTTPSVSQFRQIRKHCSLPLYVLIRPRYGDFFYTEHEFAIIEEDLRLFNTMGAEGVVTGCLLADGQLDRERMAQLRQAADGMQMTLHRAFDMCWEPEKALEEAVSLGVDTILTSGQEENCIKGMALLGKLIKQAEKRIEILAGGGVNAEVIARLNREAGVKNFHLSGKVTLDSMMVYRKEQVSMGLPGMGEYDILRTDEKKIRQAREKINALQENEK